MRKNTVRFVKEGGADAVKPEGGDVWQTCRKGRGSKHMMKKVMTMALSLMLLLGQHSRRPMQKLRLHLSPTARG